jgi:hypothetical protein
VINAAPNLMAKDDALELARSIKEAGGADLIVIDTLAQVTPGADENAAKDMGVLVKHCKGLSDAARGAAVMLIHHAGKDAGRGLRGSTLLLGAADTVLRVERMAAGRLLTVEKQKDGEDGQRFSFELEVVQIGVDEDLDPITSCVVKELQALPAHQVAAARKKLGKWETLIVEAFNAMTQSSGDTSVDCEQLVDKAVELAPPHDGPGRDTRRQHLKRAMENMGADELSGFQLEDGVFHAE